jgi:hypothetical protein
MKMGMTNELERSRAWVLIMADDTESVIDQIFELDEGEDDLVVVRADVVGGGFVNLVAAIDADPDNYEDAKSELMGITGIQNIWFLEVTEHHPRFIYDPEFPDDNEAPHDASGFITENEYEAGEKKEGVSAGRQDNSPGFNPWG